MFAEINRPQIGVLLLLLLAGESSIAAVTHFLVENERAREVSNIQRDARDRVIILREFVKNVIDKIDALQALGLVVARLDRDGPASSPLLSQEELRRWHQVMRGGVVQIAVIDPDGYMRWSNINGLAKPVYLGDREHFRAIAEGGSSMYISGPLVGRVSKRYTIQFARGDHEQDGKLAAVIVVSLDPAALIPEGLNNALGQDNTVSVFRRDGTVMAHEPRLPQLIAFDVNSDRFKAMITDETTVVGGPSLVDKRQRWEATASIPGTDLFGSVGIDIESKNGNIQQQIRTIQTRGVVTGLLLIGVTAVWTQLSNERKRIIEAKKHATLREAHHTMMTTLLLTRSIIFHFELSDISDSKIRFVSDSVFLVTGYQPFEILNRVNWIMSRVHRDDQDSYRVHCARLLEVGRSSAKYRLKHKANHWIWVQTMAEQQVTDGKALFTGHMRDMTSEHLLYMQVVQNSKLAMLGAMTTGMAHELNQPLATISLAAENAVAMLDDTQEDTHRQRQKLERIIAQVDRAAQIIDHMRIFGRQRGEAFEFLSIYEQIDSVLNILRSRLRNDSIVVTLDGDTGGGAVRGDKVAFQQVLMNLIGNAIDAITEALTPMICERRTIHIDFGMVSGQVRIAITDRAGGVTEEIRARMFEPFFTTKPIGSGTGLGLSISYGIIQEMGGLITATNVQDGLQVEILLPAHLRG